MSQAAMFTWFSIGLSMVVAVVLFVKFRDKREWWYVFLIPMFLAIPFELIGDTYTMVMDYSWAFTMIPGTRMPVMMIFAYVMFFSVPYILADAFLRPRLQKHSKVFEAVMVLLVFCIWDFVVEYSSTFNGLWTYYWPTELMIGGALPFTTPLLIMFFSVAFYYIWPIAERLSDGKGWWKGFLIHFGSIFVVFSALNTFILLILRFIGIMPIPLDVSLSHDSLTADQLHELCYRYVGLFPPVS